MNKAELINAIAEKAGLVKLIAKAIKPITKWLFKGVPEESEALGNVALSFSANACWLILCFLRSCESLIMHLKQDGLIIL